MKTFLFILLFSTLSLFLLNNLSGQGVSINEDGAEADASAMLDIKSTSKGLLAPRMNLLEMFSITSPAEGLMVYCTSFNSYYYYNGSIWTKIVGGEDDDWTLDGNDMYSNNSGLIGIGTTTTLPTHKLTIENSENNKLLRLIGTGPFGEYARLSFGDGDYVYIQEFYDDKLLMYASSGLGLSSNFDIEVQSGYGNVQVYTPQGNVSIKDDPSAGVASAILDISSTSKGLLIPRMTVEQITAISDPADGLQVYNTTAGKIYIFVGNDNCWREVSYGTTAIYFQTFETCGDVLTDTRDGQTYNTVDINGQCWMAENLNYGTMISTGNYQNNNGTPEKYCLNNSTSFCNELGGLYMWNELMDYNPTPGGQGICPDGWHVPTDAEWFALENFVDPSISNPSATGWRGSTGGRDLKSTATGGSYNWTANPGTDDHGFTTRPGGYRNTSGYSSGTSTNAAFWTSTQGCDREFYYSYNSILRYTASNGALGLSARCIKD